MDFVNKIFKGDRVIWIIFMLLCLVSVVEVFSATSTLTYKVNANHWGPIIKHTQFLLIGAIIVLILHHIPTKFISLGIFLLPVSIVLLCVTLVGGVVTNDASRWLSLFGFQFQPSEIAKLSCIIFVAFALSRRNMFTENQVFYAILAGVGTTCLLIVSENFSTAIMLFGVCYLMMWIGLLPWKKMLALTGILLFVASLFLLLLLYLPPDLAKKYMPDRFVTWQGRVQRFFEPKVVQDEKTYVISGENYQESHAKIAIARGGAIGVMPGYSQQRDFLPQAYSDFIYAIIIEEMGYIGGVAVMFLYIFLLIRVGVIARRCDKLFPKFLVLGCGILIVVQAFFNMAVAVDLLPVTGQPLPLISRGGTSTVITCCYIGIILSVSRFGAGMDNDDIEDVEEEEVESTALIENSEVEIPPLIVQNEEYVIESEA